MRILFIGDIVGRSGRTVLLDRLPRLIAEWKLDLAIVNGENAAGGFGITEAIYEEFVDAGADAITLGNHAWDQREALVFIERAPRLIRPINYPAGTPGRGVAMIDAKNGKRALVMNVMGRIFMDALDDPFAAVERELTACALGSGRRRHRHRHALRGDQREAGDGLHRRRPREPRGRHPHPRADLGPPHPQGRHGVRLRCRHDRRLRLRHRHGARTSRSAVSSARSRRASSSRRTVRPRSARWRWKPTMRRGWPRGSGRCVSAARWKKRGRRSGVTRNGFCVNRTLPWVA